MPVTSEFNSMLSVFLGGLRVIAGLLALSNVRLLYIAGKGTFGYFARPWWPGCFCGPRTDACYLVILGYSPCIGNTRRPSNGSKRSLFKKLERNP
ncbi:hypothetical protein BDY19DRAFT_972665, partial [Irpex rosettiformis]